MAGSVASLNRRRHAGMEGQLDHEMKTHEEDEAAGQ
jgi:hypothetical protein